MDLNDSMRISPFMLMFNILLLITSKVNGFPVPMTLVSNAAAKGAGL